jgi:hypothetical protein
MSEEPVKSSYGVINRGGKRARSFIQVIGSFHSSQSTIHGMESLKVTGISRTREARSNHPQKEKFNKRRRIEDWYSKRADHRS